ncbi:hypothetical protein DFJ73DRAFT_755976 [Zopfochytrium polystomum]|nr:hypothetical protein DFJ73DRAFT_755976 [Zopfochytrium polystomum]
MGSSSAARDWNVGWTLVPGGLLNKLDPNRNFAKHRLLSDADLERAFLLTHPGLRSLRLDGDPPPPAIVEGDDDSNAAASVLFTTPLPPLPFPATDSPPTPEASTPFGSQRSRTPPLVFQHIRPSAAGAIAGASVTFAADATPPMLTPTYDLLSTAPRCAVRLASASPPGSPHVFLDLLTGNTAATPPTLVEGVNGEGVWAIAGILRIRNEGKKSFRGSTVSKVVGSRKGGKHQAGVLVPFRFKLFDAPPIVLVENVDVVIFRRLMKTFTHPSVFPSSTPGPPSIDLIASVAHPSATAVTYRLSASTHDSKPPSLLSPCLPPPGSPHLHRPSPRPSHPSLDRLRRHRGRRRPRSRRRSAAPADHVPGLAWWARVATPTVAPGGEARVQIAVAAGQELAVTQVEVSLTEFVAAASEGGEHTVDARPWGGRRRRGSPVAPVPARRAADERSPARVPPHASLTARTTGGGGGPTVDGAPLDAPRPGSAPQPLRRLGKVSSPCVNYDGRWNGVVVAHEVVCKLTVERTATGFVDWVEAAVPVAVAESREYGRAVTGGGSDLPRY